jgi:hypothetical protein
MKKTYVFVKGVRFEVLGPVDRRLSVEFTPRGRVICPYCVQGGGHRKYAGSFSVRVMLQSHLREEHYRCSCGWVGISPGAHVTRSANHRGPVPVDRPKPRRVRISDLASDPVARGARAAAGRVAGLASDRSDG